MNIGYVRGVFPKLTETFILEELWELQALGHRIRIYASHGEFGQVHDKLLRSGLLDRVVYSWGSQRTGFFRALGLALKLAATLIFDRGFRSRYFAGMVGGGELPGRLWSCLRRKHGRAFVPWMRSILGIVRQSCAIPNLSLSLNQCLLQSEEFVPDVIHCPFTFQQDVLRLRHLLWLHPTKPFTLTLRARDLHGDWRREGYATLKEALWRSADRITTISDFNRATLRRLMPDRPDIPVIHSCIDAGLFCPGPVDAGRDAEIVAVARFIPKKGLAHLIEACALIQGRLPAMRCRIVGEGPLREALGEVIRARGLAGRVTLEGPCTQEEIRDILRRATVFALPCVEGEDGDRDILPNSLKEAMALQLPVVTSDISGIRELITDRVDGTLVPPGSPRALADALLRLCADPELRRAMGRKAREKILAQFTSGGEVRKLAGLLEAAVAERARQNAEIAGRQPTVSGRDGASDAPAAAAARPDPEDAGDPVRIREWSRLLQPPALRCLTLPSAFREPPARIRTGELIVSGIIEESAGAVREPRVQQSLDPEWDATVLDATRQWRFFPGRSAGKFVRCRVWLRVRFPGRDRISVLVGPPGASAAPAPT